MAQTLGRCFAFCIYEGDSAPENWRKILNNMHLQWCCSPLHDADLNGDESEKKVHRHVMLFYDGKKSLDQIIEITDELHGTIPIIVKNPVGMVRYLVHMDNPEKHQYSIDEVECYGGLDIYQYFKSTRYQTRVKIIEIIQECNIHHITEYKDLIDWCISNERDDFLDCALFNTLAISAYLKSAHFKLHDEIEGRYYGPFPEVSKND